MSPTTRKPPSPIENMGELYAIARGLVKETIQWYQQISEEQIAYQNIDVADLFKDLAKMELARLESMETPSGLDMDTISHPEALNLVPLDRRAGLIRDSMGNPYLLTPYRALQLAVTDKLWIFEYFSEVASVTEEEIIRQRTEKFALDELELAAQLRRKRRIAYRQETGKEKTSSQSKDYTTITTPEDFAEFVAGSNIVICAMAYHIEQIQAGGLPDKISLMLLNLRNRLCKQTDCSGPISTLSNHYSQQGTTTLFSSLRVLLSEIEAACDMSLDIAGSSQDEQVVANAQETTKIYVELLAIVRNEIISIPK